LNIKTVSILSKTRYIKKINLAHPVFDNIEFNLAEITILMYTTISQDNIKASSELTTERNKIPINKIDYL